MVVPRLVSIPQGTIKRVISVMMTPAFLYVSIPQGTIKRKVPYPVEKDLTSVSIPQGTIKSTWKVCHANDNNVFQFHKVRLKVKQGFRRDKRYARFNSTRYD